MTDTPTAVEVCCCGNCEAAGHEQTVTRALTAEELAANAAAVQAEADRKAAAEAEAEAIAAAKASANAKLKALGLSDEEISALSK
jgi:hypothetical protein